MKFAVSFFSMLVVIVGAVLFWQYQVFSDQLDKQVEDYTYSQEIEIVYRGESLDIRHHFKNLPKQEIDIQWPKAAVNPGCFIEAEYSCTRLTEDTLKFAEGETHAQSVSYVIPMKSGLTSRELMKNVFATLKGGDVHFSTVHITTDRDINGQWITGLPLVGQQQLKLVNYSMFSGTGKVKDLFWQAEPFTIQKQAETLAIYSKTPLKTAFYDKLANVEFLSDEHIAIINGTNTVSGEGYRMLFIPEITVAKVQQHVVISQLESSYQFGDSPHWLKEMVASYLTGDVFGSEKTAEVVDTLTAQMSDSQLADWTARLKALEGQKITPEVLDAEVSAVLGASTAYITMNAQTKGTFPFLFNDPREIYVDVTKNEEVQVILKDGQILYSADSLLRALGYEVSTGPNGYYVNSETRVFRFPKQPGFYVFNQRRYNTVSEPIKVVAGEYFIEESWLQRLFLVELTKSDNRITITTTAK
ncbi:MAG: RNA polymerase II [Solibacillus sp.]